MQKQPDDVSLQLLPKSRIIVFLSYLVYHLRELGLKDVSMCGIFTLASADPAKIRKTTSQIDEILDTIQHRGPNERGHASSANSVLGMTRLSIIDTENGSQPIHSQDGRYSLVLNGEIYNYIELRQELERKGVVFQTDSDSEVLLEAFQAYGTKCLKMLNGMFAFAIKDHKKDELILARDRAGEKPLYYWHDDSFENFVFASEIKALKKISWVPFALSKKALYELLQFNYVPGHQTIYEGICQLPPGNFISIKLGQAPIKSDFWKFNPVTPPAENFDASNWKDIFFTLFESAIKIRLRSDVPLGLFLSSGIDSNSVAWGMRKVSDQNYDAFSISFDDPKFDESVFAEKSAKDLGLTFNVMKSNMEAVENLPKIMHFLDQPHGDASFIPLHDLCNFAAKKVKVVLTGDGGDELFGGYSKYNSFVKLQNEGKNLSDVLFEYHDEVCSVFTDDAIKEIWPDGHATYSGSAFSRFADVYSQADGLDSINKLIFSDFKLLLQGNNLIKPDRMGMANSLELRAPFLDHNLIEHAFRLPGKYKCDALSTKIYFREILEGYIPDYLLNLKKMMLTVPIGNWYKNELKDMAINTVMNNEELFQPGFFNKSAVQKILEDHIEGKANNTRQVRLLVAISIWMQQNR